MFRLIADVCKLIIITVLVGAVAIAIPIVGFLCSILIVFGIVVAIIFEAFKEMRGKSDTPP